MASTLEPQDWAAALAHAAHDIQDQNSLRETLDRAVFCAVELVEGCDAAGILGVGKGTVHTLTSSDATAAAADDLQRELHAGPSYEVLDGTGPAFRVADLATAPERWEPFTTAAVDAGIAGAMAVPLLASGTMLGVLNLYSFRPDGLTLESERLAVLLASHIAVAFSAARSEENLRIAVTSHQEIGEAVGILMERHRVNEHGAFAMLRKASQERNVKLRELARRLVQTGETAEIS